MTKYTAKQVKEYITLYITLYGQMAHLNHEFEEGFMGLEMRDAAQKIICDARRFPEELKDEKFKFYLTGLEKIVEIGCV